MNYLALSPELFELANALPILFGVVVCIAIACLLLACVSDLGGRY